MSNSADLPPPHTEASAPPTSINFMSGVIMREDRARSMPALQFEFQIDLEKERILRHFRPGGKLMKSLPMDPATNIKRLALHNIRARWMQWGIWDDNWEVAEKFGHWMHEDLDEEGKPFHPDYDGCARLYGDMLEYKVRYTEKPKDEATLNKSRPINQFWSQIAHEREFLEETGLHDPAKNIDEQARENVRQRWVFQKMWSENWHDVPGDKWDHELVDFGSLLRWFHKPNRLYCGYVHDIFGSLPGNPSMWFRTQPGGNDYGCIEELVGGPKIVPCNCMPPSQRKLLRQNPVTSPSELAALYAVPSTEVDEVLQAAVLLATNRAVSKQVRKPRARPQQTSDAPRRSLRLQQTSVAPRRSLRLQQKQERAAQKQIASKAIATKPIAKKRKREGNTKSASSSTRRTT